MKLHIGCANCDWTGCASGIKDGRCPKCGSTSLTDPQEARLKELEKLTIREAREKRRKQDARGGKLQATG